MIPPPRARPLEDPAPDPVQIEGRPVIVLGDAHLHETCDPAIGADLVRLVVAAPARAVIVFNGDLFDLDRVHGDPEAGIGPWCAVQRLERVLDRHPAFEAALVRHVGDRDGILLFVAGNHDAELLLPQVHEALIRRLGGVTGRVLALDRLSVGSVAIEHGHQTDPDAAFFPDTRGAVERQRLSAFPLASLMTRLFVSEHPRYEAAGLHYEAPLAVLMGVLRNYKLAGLWMAITYPFVASRITWQSLLARSRRDVPAEPSSLTMSSPWQVVRRLYLDRYFVTVCAMALLVMLSIGWVRSGFWWLFGAMTAWLVMPPSGRRRTFGERDLRTTAAQAELLADQGARVIVFGHTHRAFVENLRGAVFANHGAFSIPVEIDESGSVCAGGRPASRLIDDTRKARPYLEVALEPPSCELRALRLRQSTCAHSTSSTFTPASPSDTR